MSSQTNQVSDEPIAWKAQSGSLVDFEELVRRYEARIFRFVAARSLNPSDAEELTQDVFIAAYRGIDRFDPRRSFATWLFTIARRKCIDYSRRRRPEITEILPELSHANDPGSLLAQREADENLWRIARGVTSDMQYDALWLRCAEAMEVAEIARVMKLTHTHVKVLLFRARLRLEKALRSKATEVKRPVDCLTTEMLPAVTRGGI